jgi:hypothetical protein
MVTHKTITSIIAKWIDLNNSHTLVTYIVRMDKIFFYYKVEKIKTKWIIYKLIKTLFVYVDETNKSGLPT